jgi:osmotically-inducible protein OsmY
MKRSTPPKVITLVLAPLSMSGCAAFREYRECGLNGCGADTQISKEVNGRMNQHWQFRPDVNVETANSVVYLWGVVNTDTERDAAEAIAQNTPGVRKVVSNVTADEDSGA